MEIKIGENTYSADQEYAELCRLLFEINKKFPTQRLAGILQSSVDQLKRKKNYDIGDLTNKELLVALKEYLGDE